MYSGCQRPVPLHHQYPQRLLVPESGITPTVSSDNQRTRTNFVDVFCAVFTIAQHVDYAALTEGSCRKHVLPNLRMRAALTALKLGGEKIVISVVISITELLAASRWESASSQMK